MSTINIGTSSTTAFKVESDTTGALLIKTGAGLTTAVTVDASQNVGVGVTPPTWGTFKTQVIGGAGTFIAGAVGQLSIGSNARYNAGWIYVETDATSRYDQISGQHRWFSASSGNAGDYITYTEKMRLDVNGNLGLGVTPSAWNVFKAIQIGAYGDSLAAYQGGGGNLGLTHNATTTDNAVTWTYTTSNAAARYLMDGLGVHTWYTAASGTAGNTITWTTAAKITSGAWFKASNNGSWPLDATGCHEFSSNQNVVTLFVSNTRTSGNEQIMSVNHQGFSPNNTSAWFIYCADLAAERFSVRSNGGIANYQANNVNLSDRREKTNFAPAKNYLNVLCQIPVQTFNYIDQNHEDDPGLTLGVVAQDVQAVAPELVMESNWGSAEDPKLRLSIYQTDLQYAMLKAIQELAAEVAALKGAK